MNVVGTHLAANQRVAHTRGAQPFLDEHQLGVVVQAQLPPVQLPVVIGVKGLHDLSGVAVVGKPGRAQLLPWQPVRGCHRLPSTTS